MDRNGNNSLDSGGGENNSSSSPATAINVEDDSDIRRCSIGSASSLIGDNNNNGDRDSAGGFRHQLSVPEGAGAAAGGAGAGGNLGRQLSIRRVSDISHINELRR